MPSSIKNFHEVTYGSSAEAEALAADRAASKPSMEFCALSLKHKKLDTESLQRYRVYRSAVDYVVIDATTASEAIEKSGIEEPFKVIKTFAAIGEVLDPAFLADITAATETVPSALDATPNS